MYESFYGFSSRPFLAVPVTNRYFPATAIETARANLIRCVERSEGCGLVMGPTGSGISLLCEVIAEHFRGKIDAVLLGGLRLTNCRELLQAVLHTLGQPHLRMTDGELRLALVDAVSPSGSCPQGIVLIVDEAHRLPLRAFEELRFMTNMVRESNPGVRLVMAGGNGLEERLADPRLVRMNQRVAVRCYLLPYTAEETFQYVRAQTAAAGTDPDRLWAMDALKTIQRYADGCPRLINQLCDHALLLAAQEKVPQLCERDIEVAWADLQQIPTGNAPEPCNQATEKSGEVIEFASLEDETGEQREPANSSNETIDPVGQPYQLPEPDEAITEENHTDDASCDEVVAAPVSDEMMDEGLSQTIISQNGELPDSVEVAAQQFEEQFEPHPAASEQTPSPVQNRPTPQTGIIISDFVGIDGGHVVPLASAQEPKPESPTSVEPQRVAPPQMSAAGHDDEVNMPHGANEQGTADQQTNLGRTRAVPATGADEATHAENTYAPQRKSHSLIPIPAHTVKDLVADLQVAHVADNPALKNLVQP